MRRRAQIKMAENIGILVIFFVLIVIAIIFFIAFQTSSIEEQVSEFKTRNAVQLATKVALLPEFQCRKNNVQENHCLDKLKFESAKIILTEPSNEDYYFKILGYSTIKVKSIYPNLLEEMLYNKIKPEFTNNDTFSIPVSVYNPITSVHNFGVLEVNVYA